MARSSHIFPASPVDKRLPRSWRWLGALLGLIMAGMLLGPGIASAQGGPPPDYACRMCHGDTKTELTLPSGETLAVRVPLDALDASAHSLLGEKPVYCNDCHDDWQHYRVPHQPPEAQTLAEFRATMAGLCQNCHVPHQPFHADVEEEKAPTCVDCHGSHDVLPAESALAHMPDACLACHEDKDRAWAETLLTPRPGWGEPAAGYIGTARCLGCHEQEVAAWRSTWHARGMEDPAAHPDAVLGDFDAYNPLVTFEREEIRYTLGGRWTQQYALQQEDGRWMLAPAQWRVDEQTWAPYQSDVLSEQEQGFPQSCGSCHLTGYDPQSGGFREIGVGCESCHGPGEAHAADPKNMLLYKEVDDQVCGACHSRGRSPAGHPYPETYRPGDVLAEHFHVTSDPAAVWPDGSARLNHQQYMDWNLGSKMARSELTNCTTCHDPHDAGIGAAALRKPLNDLCLDCHADKAAIIQHAPYHQAASQRGHDFQCTDCHMPAMTESDLVPDAHNHSMLQPDPQKTIDYGGLSAMPNACNQCHENRSETPQWAVSIIASASVMTPQPASAYNPILTVTPPPPPTPIPEAWTLPEPAGEGTPFFWLWVLAGLILLAAVIYLILRFARREKPAHA